MKNEVSNNHGVLHDVFAPRKLNYNCDLKRSDFVIVEEETVVYAEVLEIPGEETNYNSIKETLEKV